VDDHSSARSPLGLAALQAAAGAAWDVTLLPTAGSTNEIAAAGPRPGRVVVADHQISGRGRLDRSWTTPPGTALTLSAVVEPNLEMRHWPLIPLAAGLAVGDALRAVGARPMLKWPNDVLLESGKVAGILVERIGEPGRAIIGIGINVDLAPSELPVPTATALSLEGVTVTRTALLGGVLLALASRLEALESDPEAFVATYRDACDTVGREVEAHLPGGVRERGQAIGVDDSGRLQIQVGDRVVAMAAGDVVHLRPV
jgi:BirA family biotin operon repressor/biotin-[acetyl-CoA-carboxylase] ligase